MYFIKLNKILDEFNSLNCCYLMRKLRIDPVSIYATSQHFFKRWNGQTNLTIRASLVSRPSVGLCFGLGPLQELEESAR